MVDVDVWTDNTVDDSEIILQLRIVDVDCVISVLVKLDAGF